MNIIITTLLASLLVLDTEASIPRTIDVIPGFGRNLLVRSLPPIPDYQSNLYEVFMEPAYFDSERAPLQAIAVLSGENEGIGGELTFSQWTPGGPVAIQGNITGLSAGLHGLHVNLKGDLRQGCKSIGRHFNPYLHRHGGPRDPIRHLGDLGNIRAGDDGVAKVKIVDHLISLSGPRTVVGRSLAITMNEDDLGRSGTEESATDGSSGDPVACGVIAYLT